MPTQSQYKKILNHYGDPAQLAKLAEECSELSAIILKHIGMKLHSITSDTSEIDKKICEEMADVENLLPQLRLVFDSDYIDEIKFDKVVRTLERMKK
jgi:hypothetical protein